jgi:hypothetical protein
MLGNIVQNSFIESVTYNEYLFIVISNTFFLLFY